RIFSVDTGRLPAETHELIAQLRDRYPGLNLEVLAPEEEHVRRMVERKGLDLFRESVENRLLCCNVRKVRPLTRHLATLDAWITGLRRDQWATRTNIRKVEIDHDHGAIVKLNPLAEWTEGEVWDYVRERELPYHPLYDRGYTSIGCAPCTRAITPGEQSRAGRLAYLIAAVGDGEIVEEEADALTELLELGLQTGRLRAVYGPGGEQAALRLFRKLPRGKELEASAREVTGALASLVGKPLE